ncbi:peptidoglycan-recognition protein LB-like isoform X1 [Euwallacea similis]|uniref:peptidoglycan-recognition protein LB-like isoform X1 n=1 Tax=Euwallacea similis TaxID=1736056 RepID=UPI00344FB0A2
MCKIRVVTTMNEVLSKEWLLLIYYTMASMGLITGKCFLEKEIEIVSRDEWGARPPTLVENMTNPVPFVVIHHSYIPAACFTKEDCIVAMQWMQDFHQFNRSWNDVGYSFAAGSDNRIYAGRGWSAVGAHAPGFNNQSIGICIIGDWTEKLPPEEQLQIVRQFIRLGVIKGYIKEDYKLIGHRQARDTDCPGDALFAEIQTWPHFDPSINITGKRASTIRKEGLAPVKTVGGETDKPTGNSLK